MQQFTVVQKWYSTFICSSKIAFCWKVMKLNADVAAGSGRRFRGSTAAVGSPGLEADEHFHFSAVVSRQIRLKWSATGAYCRACRTDEYIPHKVFHTDCPLRWPDFMQPSAVTWLGACLDCFYFSLESARSLIGRRGTSGMCRYR